MVKVPVAPQVDLQVGGLPAFQSPTAQGPLEDVSARVTQQMGQAQAQLGAGLQRIAVQLQDEINEAEAKDGDVQIADKIDQVGWGEDGYFTKQGSNALGYNRAKAIDTVRNESLKIAGAMPNPLARKMYERSAQARIERLENQMLGHAFEQTQKAKAQATQKRLVRLGRDQVMFSNDWEDPAGNYQKSRINWEREWDESVRARGLDPNGDIARGEREDALTAVHSEVVNKLINEGRVEDARKYIDRYSGEQDPNRPGREIAPEAETGLRNNLRVRDRSDQAQRYVQLEADRTKTLEEQVEDLNKKFLDPASKMSIEVRDEAEERLRRRDQLRRDTLAQESNLEFGKFQRWASQPENRWKSAEDYPDANGIRILQDRGMWDNALSFKRTSTVITTPETWLEVMDINRQGGWDQPQFATPALTQAYFSSNNRRLSNEDMMNVLTLRMSQLNPEQKPIQTTSLLSPEEEFDIWARSPEVGLYNENEPKAGQEKYFKALRQFQARINFYETEIYKRKATPEEVRNILSDIEMDKARTETWRFGYSWMNRDKSVFAIQEGEMEDYFVRVQGKEVYLTEIPPQVREWINYDLARHGKSISAKAVAEAWVMQGRPETPPPAYLNMGRNR